MRRAQRLELALARTKNARTKLRLFADDRYDAMEHDRAMMLLDQARSIIENMLARQRTRDANQGGKKP